MPDLNPDAPALAAVCGLFCGACSVHLATREDPARLARLAAKLGQTVEETRCEGCRSSVVSKHCRSCELASCAKSRGISFCGACDAFPCERIETFRKARPHRNELLPDMARIVEAGAATWLQEVAARYACPGCGTTNSAYDLQCRSCGHAPGSPYAAEHGDAIRKFL